MAKQDDQNSRSRREPLSPSRRALRNISHQGNGVDSDLDGVTYYDPIKHPEGLIDISGSSNEGMRDVLQKYCKSYTNDGLALDEVLKYGQVAGPEELNDAMAKFFNEWFAPHTAVQPSDIMTTNGVSALLDSIAFNICDPGEGIMVPVPTYSQFQRDFADRADVRLVPVPMNDYHLQFHRDHRQDFVLTLEKAYKLASHQGICIKALLICSPSNPLGRCYPRETLIEVARFCGRCNLHLVSDEIYALSCFRHELQEVADFTSVLALPEEPEHGVAAENIHCLYGVSKDWAMGGIRLGFIVSRNKPLWKACRRLALFSWVTHFSTRFWVDFIRDQDAVRDYVRLNQSRLRQKNLEVSSLLHKRGIPHLEANAGLFIWLNLSKWLQYFPGGHEGDQNETLEVRLTRHMIKYGVYMGMGSECLSPDSGRYRFVFTSPGDEAFLAVNRIAASLKALESSGQVAEAQSNGPVYDSDSTLELDTKLQNREQPQQLTPSNCGSPLRKNFWIDLISCNKL